VDEHHRLVAGSVGLGDRLDLMLGAGRRFGA
jgi:hypothetical protein